MSEESAYFRLYALKAGHTLTADDVADIQQVLAEYNDEIGNAADQFHNGRMDAYHDIGGEELVAAVTARDDAAVKAAADKALERFFAKQRALAKGETP